MEQININIPFRDYYYYYYKLHEGHKTKKQNNYPITRTVYSIQFKRSLHSSRTQSNQSYSNSQIFFFFFFERRVESLLNQTTIIQVRPTLQMVGGGGLTTSTVVSPMEIKYTTLKLYISSQPAVLPYMFGILLEN